MAIEPLRTFARHNEINPAVKLQLVLQGFCRKRKVNTDFTYYDVKSPRAHSISNKYLCRIQSFLSSYVMF